MLILKDLIIVAGNFYNSACFFKDGLGCVFKSKNLKE